MSDNDTQKGSSQSDSRGLSYTERKERIRELKGELRDLRHCHPGHGIFAGILILLVGCIFLAGNLFGINVGQWWPLLVIAVGIAILSRAFYGWR